MGRGKKATKCLHIDSLLYAKGLCKQCYQAGYSRSRKPKPGSCKNILNDNHSFSFNGDFNEQKRVTESFYNYEDENEREELVVDFKLNRTFEKKKTSQFATANNNIMNYKYSQLDNVQYNCEIINNDNCQNIEQDNNNSTISNYSNFCNFR